MGSGCPHCAVLGFCRPDEALHRVYDNRHIRPTGQEAGNPRSVLQGWASSQGSFCQTELMIGAQSTEIYLFPMAPRTHYYSPALHPGTYHSLPLHPTPVHQLHLSRPLLSPRGTNSNSLTPTPQVIGAPYGALTAKSLSSSLPAPHLAYWLQFGPWGRT